MDAEGGVGVVLQVLTRANPNVEKISGNQHPIPILSSEGEVSGAVRKSDQTVRRLNLTGDHTSC